MLKKIIDFLANNWIGVVICMVITLFVFWIVGYFANGLLGYKFEIGSIWQGILALSGPGVIGIAKYYVDSKHNSIPGQIPCVGNSLNEKCNDSKTV